MGHNVFPLTALKFSHWVPESCCSCCRLRCRTVLIVCCYSRGGNRQRLSAVELKRLALVCQRGILLLQIKSVGYSHSLENEAYETFHPSYCNAAAPTPAGFKMTGYSRSLTFLTASHDQIISFFGGEEEFDEDPMQAAATLMQIFTILIIVIIRLII